MLNDVVDAFKKLGLPGVRNDDFFDRLSRRYSLIILGISFFAISSSHFMGKPIHCFTQNVPGSHIDYINSVCWISSSYYLPFEKPLPNRNQTPPERIPYYQWVPFILFVMMTFFFLPGFIWRKMNQNCGIDTKVIGKAIGEMDPLNSEKRREAMQSLVKHIDKALIYHRDYHHGFMTWKRCSYLFCCALGRRSGNYLSAGYIFVKLLYILNALGQLFLLNIFLGNRFHLFGFEILQKWFDGETIEALERFPRITMCRFTIRTLGDNIQKYDVQCLLPINIYNEKIFLFIWFWLAFVSVSSIYGLIKWFRFFTLKSRKNFIRRYLKANGIDYYSEHVTQAETEILRTFVDNYCRQDGILLLRIISANTNNVIVGELISNLWDQWQQQRQVRVNPILESTDHFKNVKTLNDYDGNQSTLTNSRVPLSTVQEDRYMLSPLRL